MMLDSGESKGQPLKEGCQGIRGDDWASIKGGTMRAAQRAMCDDQGWRPGAKKGKMDRMDG